MVFNMAKKSLNKMVLLPLFLAAVTLGAAGVLTGVHLLTAPYVEKNELNKKYAGYKQILEIDSFDEVKELTVSDSLKAKGVTLKQSFIVGGVEAGVVYDANITGWSPDLIFQVGFKGNVYAGFNLISSKETPGIGADYLKLVNDRIKGKAVDSPVLVDTDGTYTGVTAPATGTPLKEVLELCAADYSGSAIPEPEPTSVDNLNLALNLTTATEFNLLTPSSTLKTAGLLFKYEVLAGTEKVGIVYEAKVRGFKDGMHFLVGFSGTNYAGFKLIASSETPVYGGDYLNNVNDWIKGQPANSEVLTDSVANAGVTRTVDGLKTMLALCATDYLEGGTI